MAMTLKSVLIEELKNLLVRDPEELVAARVDKFAGMGVWSEE